MKQGKRLTRSQRSFIEEHDLNSNDWLVTKDTPDAMEIVHRVSEEIITLNK